MKDLIERLREAPQSLSPREIDILAANAEAAANRPVLLSQKAVAMILGVNRTTIWRLTRAGLLPAVEIAPRMVRYRQADLDRLAKDGWQSLVGGSRNAA